MLFRELLRISSRVGSPGTLLQLGDADGRILYLQAAMSPVSVVVGLEDDDVRRLHAALGEWLAGRAGQQRPAPLIAGRIRAGLADVSAGTVQLCTVREAAQAPDQGTFPAPV